MKLTEMAQVTLAPDVQKKANRTLSALKKNADRFAPSTIEMKIHGTHEVEFVIEFKKWMRPAMIEDAYSTLNRAIADADKEGHIHKVEENGVGAEFVEALLSGLTPGMKPIKAEAFFPTMMFTVKWKQIIKK